MDLAKARFFFPVQILENSPLQLTFMCEVLQFTFIVKCYLTSPDTVINCSRRLEMIHVFRVTGHVTIMSKTKDYQRVYLNEWVTYMTNRSWLKYLVQVQELAQMVKFLGTAFTGVICAITYVIKNCYQYLCLGLSKKSIILLIYLDFRGCMHHISFYS